jgi:hypothetical protein
VGVLIRQTAYQRPQVRKEGAVAVAVGAEAQVEAGDGIEVEVEVEVARVAREAQEEQELREVRGLEAICMAMTKRRSTWRMLGRQRGYRGV